MQKKYIIIIVVIVIIFIAILSNFLDTSIDGQTIAFIGDSIMKGYGNDDKSFEYYFQKSLPNSKLINIAKPGSTISDNTGTDDIVIINQVKALKENPDIIIFDGGGNDIIAYGLGFIDDKYKKEIGTAEQDPNKMTDTNTVLGDFEEIIVELQNKFPNTKLYYLQVFLIDDETIDKITLNGERRIEMRQRRDALYGQIKTLCEKRNVEYIDVSDKFSETEKTYRQDDWIHLKEQGYQVLVPYILEKLEKK